MGKRKLIAIMILVSLPIVIAGLRKLFTRTYAEKVTIGIIQTASHPALDAARLGFMQEAEHLFKGNVTFIIRNAQGSIDALQTIAQQFHHNQSVDGIYAIATPALQSVAHIEKRKPIFFAAVTDPYQLNILSTETNITGITDLINPELSLMALKLLIPQIKKVGIIFSASETNSLVLVKEFEKLCKHQHIAVRKIALSNEADVSAAVTHAINDIEALIAPTDNMVATTAPLIGKIAEKYKIPFMVSDNLLLPYACISNGIDYTQTGRQVAQQAYQVLTNHKHPYEVPICTAQETTPLVNQAITNALGITLSQEALCTLTIVEQGEDHA